MSRVRKTYAVLQKYPEYFNIFYVLAYSSDESIKDSNLLITHSQQQSQFLDAVSKAAERSLLISKANHSISQ